MNQPSVFPSGNAVILYDTGYPGLPVHIQFLSPFNPLVNLTDDLTTVAGLPNTMYDLPDLGAALRLMDPREVKRNFYESQPDPRKAVEIPPQAVANSSAKLEARRTMRIGAEADRITFVLPRSGELLVSFEVCFTDPWLRLSCPDQPARRPSTSMSPSLGMPTWSTPASSRTAVTPSGTAPSRPSASRSASTTSRARARSTPRDCGDVGATTGTSAPASPTRTARTPSTPASRSPRGQPVDAVAGSSS